MAFQDADEFIFQAPAEEDEEDNATVIEIGSGDIINAALPANSDLVQIASRLVFNQLNKSPKRTTTVGDESKILDESRKPVYVASLLQKLDSIDSLEEAQQSLPCWRALVFFCSSDDGSISNSAAVAFVKNGGIALMGRTLHDFLIRCRELGENSYLDVVTEILRCLVAISTSATFINFDTEWIADILGSLIDLNEWMLMKQDFGSSKDSGSSATKLGTVKAKLGPKTKKDADKLSILFPAIRNPIGATDFDIFSAEFSSDDAAIIKNETTWTLKPPSGVTSDSSIASYETITLISAMNPVTYLAIGQCQSEILNAICSAVDQLTKNGADLESCKTRPMLGSIWLSSNGYYRALVTTLDGAKSEVTIFAIDYGFTKKVPWASLRQMPEELKKIKPAVFLCFTQNAVPAPDTLAFEEALKVLQNLSLRKTTIQPLLKRNVVEALLLILRLIEHEPVVEMALKILTNLASPSMEDRNVMLESGCLGQLFLLGADLTEKSDAQSNASTSNLLQCVMECLTSLVKYNQSARRLLTEMKVALLPTYILSHYGKDTAVYQAAWNLSAALFSEKVAAKEWQEKMKSWGERAGMKKDCSALNKLLMDALKVKGGKVSFDASLTPEMAKWGMPNETKKSALTPTADVQEILHRVAVPLSVARIYMRGEKVHFADGVQWNVLCDEIMDLHQLKTRFIQELCCAALNSRQRLTIYFGLEKDGRVRGIRVNQWEGDEFRIGIDWSLSRAFRPFLEPTMYNVEFVRVCVGSHQPKAVPDLYVVELQIRHIATEAYQLDKDGAVYFRINDQVVQLSLHEAGEYIAHQLDLEKKSYRLRLRRQIAILKAVLGEERDK